MTLADRLHAAARRLAARLDLCPDLADLRPSGPPEPPEPVYTAILAAPYNPGDLAPHVLAGWDRIAAAVTGQARALGIDVDDPYTLTVMAAALVMAEAYHENHPVTLDGAVRLHETAWKVRLRDLDRHGAPSPNAE